ncbi:MAG: ectonucleotide pyrophosphatase/phosphodiesterase [Alphaproteobacteria bacterium]|nr:ectonucleotide pyrophosphatase/phosphodiesterase [Alphaproteobacteria bacterium]
MNWRRFFVAGFSALLLAACATSDASGPALAEGEPITILISLDGFRPDYLDRGITPALSQLAADGVRASMRPSFPSVTFPNHYTLVTGLHPGRHGLVNNRMEDPQRPGVVFTLQDRNVASDEIWWADGTPIWVTAERQGVRTGTMFWPGSEYEIHGQRPSRFRNFDQSLPGFARTDVLLSWLDLPEAERPRFFTLYFDLVDTAGHRFGPDALETNAAIAEVDAAIGRLVAGLDARGYAGRVNFVIVADHGMASQAADAIIELDPRITPQHAHVLWDGQFAAIQPLAGQEAAVEQALVGRSEHGECWRKSELPARFDYSEHRRVPAIVCLADIGWRYRSTQLAQYATPALGGHGWDPQAPEMAAVFIANGPAFRHGATLPTFENVSVYPLLTRLIGITPEANQGDPADTSAALTR